MIQSQTIFLQLFLLVACTNANSEPKTQGKFADITNVSVSGLENAYTFNVTISSPDIGCDQYADWWEVVSASGELIYRRILLHSHVNEQPFTRSGGSVDISEEDIIWVRAHMNNTGYGGKTLKGSVKDGFQEMDFPEDLGNNLDQIAPLPDGCNF